MIYNTGETSEELKEKYNPEGSVLRKSQMRIMDMLLYIDEVGKKLNINYRLDGGNVLGAVRHGGFIPWDDDMDICMQRDDWKKLVIYMKNHPHPQFVIQDHQTDSGYYGSWAILRDLKSEYIIDSDVHNALHYRGLQVDIFPFERGNSVFLQNLAFRLTIINRLNFVLKRPILAESLYKLRFCFIYPLFRLITKVFLSRRNYFMHSYGAGWRIKFPISVCLPHKPISFEGHEFPGPANPNELLRIIYKNYMELPPVDKRDHHKAQLKIWD